MGYNTVEAEWPTSTAISQEKRDFLDHYFNLLDTSEPTAADKIAALYTEHGLVMGPAGPVRGRDGTTEQSRRP
jgi:hypothetical protein